MESGQKLARSLQALAAVDEPGDWWLRGREEGPSGCVSASFAGTEKYRVILVMIAAEVFRTEGRSGGVSIGCGIGGGELR